jgi:hypothetical protein
MAMSLRCNMPAKTTVILSREISEGVKEAGHCMASQVPHSTKSPRKERFQDQCHDGGGRRNRDLGESGFFPAMKTRLGESGYTTQNLADAAGLAVVSGTAATAKTGWWYGGRSKRGLWTKVFPLALAVPEK